ncbi:hypothetical protein Trydic_g1298 [Trypoxylus dichotomus]
MRSFSAAVTVRYLTKRYIGEYSSTSDFLYRHNVTFDNVTTEVEILDTSKCASDWATGSFIRDLPKFTQKRVRLLKSIILSRKRLTSYVSKYA